MAQNEKEMLPQEVKNPTGQCYCCKKIKECINIKSNAQDIDNQRLVCNDCNHLEPKIKTSTEDLLKQRKEDKEQEK